VNAHVGAADRLSPRAHPAHRFCSNVKMLSICSSTFFSELPFSVCLSYPLKAEARFTYSLFALDYHAKEVVKILRSFNLPDHLQTVNFCPAWNTSAPLIFRYIVIIGTKKADLGLFFSVQCSDFPLEMKWKMLLQEDCH